MEKLEALLRRTQLAYDLLIGFLVALFATAFTQVVRSGIEGAGVGSLLVALAAAAVLLVPRKLLWRKPPTDLNRRAEVLSAELDFDAAIAAEEVLRDLSPDQFVNAVEKLTPVHWSTLEEQYAGVGLSVLQRYLRFRRVRAALRTIVRARQAQPREDAESRVTADLYRSVAIKKELQRYHEPPVISTFHFSRAGAAAAAIAIVYKDMISADDFRVILAPFARFVTAVGSPGEEGCR